MSTIEKRRYKVVVYPEIETIGKKCSVGCPHFYRDAEMWPMCRLFNALLDCESLKRCPDCLKAEKTLDKLMEVL